MERIGTTLVTILVGIITVAIIAVLVSSQSQTANVLKAGGSAFSSILQAAVAPVSGGAMGPGLPGNLLNNFNSGF